MDKTIATEAINSPGPAEKSQEDKRKLTIKYLSLDSIQLDPRNPRVHGKKQVRQIARSIEAFGFNIPVVINTQGRLIAGHGRVLAAQLLGMSDVPAIRLEYLSEAQVQAFRIADNKLTENAVWNESLLAAQFKALSEVELEFSIDVTGFEMAEIDMRIEGLNTLPPGKQDLADAIPESAAKPKVTRSGDLWILDRHRLYCGEAQDAAAYSVLMQGKSAAAVFTDPPYNDPIDGNVTGFGKIHDPKFAMASGEMSEAEFTEFLTKVLGLLERNSADGALQFVCTDWRHSPELLAAARQTYTEFKNLCVWVKDVAGQGSLYRSQHELVFVFKKGKSPHRNNVQLGQFGRYRTNVWQYRRVNSLARTTDEGDLSKLHPTIKPVELVADAILDCTVRGEIVLDAFLGSGTTIIAAERTGRVCYGIELNPLYIDTIIRRWQTFTGQQAVNGLSGRNFNEIEQETANG